MRLTSRAPANGAGLGFSFGPDTSCALHYSAPWLTPSQKTKLRRTGSFFVRPLRRSRMNRHAQLKTLAEQLSQLVEVLCLDPDCQWRGHFELCLQTARGLLESSFTQDDLNSLSSL